jgi:hypothetical protein
MMLGKEEKLNVESPSLNVHIRKEESGGFPSKQLKAALCVANAAMSTQNRRRQ